MKSYYLAYGSNLNKEQMAHRCPGAVALGVAEIPDFEPVFRRGYLTIEPKEGSSVIVGIWEISKANEKALDHYEGFPKFYYKEWFQTEIPGIGKRMSMAYIMTGGHPIQEPSSYYLNTVWRGYQDFGLDFQDFQPILKARMYAIDHAPWKTEVRKDG